MTFISDPPNGELIFKDGARNVILNSSWLLGTIPAANYSGIKNITFPDFNKSWIYKWDWDNDNSWFSGLGWVNNWRSWGRAHLIAAPQEWTNTIILRAIPVGANLDLVSVKINRTQAPNSNWHDLTLIPKIPLNTTIPFAKSFVLEQGLGMSRIISIHIENGNLVLWQKQSVCAKAGANYGAYGASADWVATDKSGGEIYSSGTRGIHIKGLGRSYSFGQTIDNYVNSSDLRKCRWDGANAASTADNTNYTSIYSIEIQAKFGRRLV